MMGAPLHPLDLVGIACSGLPWPGPMGPGFQADTGPEEGGTLPFLFGTLTTVPDALSQRLQRFRAALDERKQ